ncbi:MAG: hypothetical protein ACLUD0_00260 [Eubacterium ramulus]
MAEKYGIKTISDLQANAQKNIRFGGTSDTFEREGMDFRDWSRHTEHLIYKS